MLIPFHKDTKGGEGGVRKKQQELKVLNSASVSFIFAVLSGSLIHMLIRNLSVKWYIKASFTFFFL